MVDLSQLQKVETASDLEARNKASEAESYLRSTDWYVIRLMEIGEEIPEEVKEKRAESRLAISAAR